MMGWRIVQHYDCLFGNALAETLKQFYELLLTIALLLQVVNKLSLSRIKPCYVKALSFTGQQPDRLAFFCQA